MPSPIKADSTRNILILRPDVFRAQSKRQLDRADAMNHGSVVTFDTVCLILFVSCVLSFRLYLRLFYVFLLFLISTSRHNTTNFLSLTQQQQPQPPPKYEKRKQKKRLQNEQIAIKTLNERKNVKHA
jgi:hypothetical protein